GGRPDAEGLLADLHRAHLIEEPVAGRWRMHDLIRLYAADAMAAHETELAAARTRLYHHYLDNAAAADAHLRPGGGEQVNAFADLASAVAWFDAEHGNLM